MKIEIFQDKNQLYFFRFKTDDGRILFTSNGYEDQISANNGINTSIILSSSIDFFARNIAPDGKHYFTLQDKDGKILGTSAHYNSTQALEQDITTLLNKKLKN